MEIITVSPCKWCNATGYFTDFGPGLYPLPCSNCAGIGIRGFISKKVEEQIMDIRSSLYQNIKSKTERLEIAAESFEAYIMRFIVGTEEEFKNYQKKTNESY